RVQSTAASGSAAASARIRLVMTPHLTGIVVRCAAAMETTDAGDRGLAAGGLAALWQHRFAPLLLTLALLAIGAAGYAKLHRMRGSGPLIDVNLPKSTTNIS